MPITTFDWSSCIIASIQFGEEDTTSVAMDGPQDNADIIQLANGNILISFDDATEDTHPGMDGFAQLVSAAGQPIGDSFQLNQFSVIQDERDFEIAPLDCGGFVAPFNVCGTATETTPDFDANIAALTNGNFAVAIADTDSADTDVFVRVYDATGNQVGSASLFAGAINNNQAPSIVPLEDGEFVVM